MFATYFVPKSSIFIPIIGQKIDTIELSEFIDDFLYKKRIEEKQPLSSSEKTSLIYLTKIIKETEEKGLQEIQFNEDSFSLEKTFVVIIGEKNKLYGIIMKSDLVSEKDTKILSLNRINYDLTYISPEKFTEIFHTI